MSRARPRHRALLAPALAAAALAGRFATGIVAAAVGAAVAAALARGGAGALDLATGMHCLGTVLVSAGVVGGVGWLSARGGARATAGASLAAGGMAGALAADAALQLTCEAHGALPHLLAFHLGGVALVAVAAVAVLRSVRVPSRR